MAKKEGWFNKSGSKWQTMPEQMLRYRAAAFWQRVYCPEISMGFMTTEEAEDIDDQTPISYKAEIQQKANGKPISIEVESESQEAKKGNEEAPKAQEPVETPLGEAQQRPLFMQE